MKNAWFLMLNVALLLTAYSADAQNKFYDAANTSTTVFYNVENLLDTIDNPLTKDDDFTPTGSNNWTSKRYQKKISDIAWVLANINKNELPELIGLAEVENAAVLTDLANSDALKAGKYAVIQDTALCDGRGIGTGFMYRSEMFTNVTYEMLKVKPDVTTGYRLRPILYVQGNMDGQHLHIFVNHWKSRRGGSSETEGQRNEAAQILRDRINLILKKDSKANIIVMGDMNDEPTNESLKTVLFATNNTKKTKPTELFNLMYDKHLNGLGTHSYNGAWNMLDNLIVSQNLMRGKVWTVSSDGGQIFADRKILYDNPKAGTYSPSKTYGKDYFGGFSDHLPVYFMLKK